MENIAKKPNFVLAFIKKNIVFSIATFAAILSCFFVLPDAQYIDYFDFKTLVSLFVMLAVISALRHISFFRILANKKPHNDEEIPIINKYNGPRIKD